MFVCSHVVRTNPGALQCQKLQPKGLAMNLEQGEMPTATGARETPISRLELVWGVPELANLAASTVMVLG